MKTKTKYGADFSLERLADTWLAKNDPQHPIEREAMKIEDYVIEVSIHTAIKEKAIETIYDPTNLLVDDISFKDFWDSKFEAEDYILNLGDRIIQVGGDLMVRRSNPYTSEFLEWYNEYNKYN